MRIMALLLLAMLSACATHVDLVGSDGKSQVSYSGEKVLTNTMVSLQEGTGCAVPADPNVPASPAPFAMVPRKMCNAADDPINPNACETVYVESAPASGCYTRVATVQGVNVSGLANILLTIVVAAIGMIASGS